jgi:mRNA-degrading endonuclease RelE of RelBE toxin-antitoxin system
MTKTLEEVEADVRKLSPSEQEQFREWLENLIEDRLEMTEEFKAEIAAGKRDIAEGRVRVRKP